MSVPPDSRLPSAAAEIQRLVVESLAEGVMVTDANAQIVSCNDSCTRILGLSRDELLGRTTVDPEWHTVHEDGSPFPPEDYPAFLVLKDGVPRTGVIMGVHMPGGALSWISINARPMMLEGSSEPIGAGAANQEGMPRCASLNERVACVCVFPSATF